MGNQQNTLAMLVKMVQSIFVIVSISVLTSCASVEARDKTLTMAWKAGPPTKNVVSFELNVQGEFENADGKTRELGNRTRYQASYTQSITDHPDGLLVQQTNFKVAEPDNFNSGISPSKMQIVILKVTALLFASRPDYIVKPNGEFVGFHQFEKYEQILDERISNAVGGPFDQVKQMFAEIFEAGKDETLLKKQIDRDLSLLREWDQLSLILSQPIKKTITPAYTGKDKKDYMADGMLSYKGAHKCNWKTKSRCVELTFRSNEEKVYDVNLIVEPDSLTLHSYLANSLVSIQNTQNGIKMSNTSTAVYSHTVEANE